jgi:hypothetical protein
MAPTEPLECVDITFSQPDWHFDCVPEGDQSRSYHAVLVKRKLWVACHGLTTVSHSRGSVVRFAAGMSVPDPHRRVARR